jgi:5-methylcytosine-specific restriction endonuclease McrA
MRPKSIYNDWTWLKLSRLQRQREPLCERCAAAGRLAFAELVHHKIPITEETRHLMYDVANLESLCRPCHEHIHGRGEAPLDYSDTIDPQTGLYTDPNHPSNKRPVTRGWGTRAERLQK